MLKRIGIAPTPSFDDLLPCPPITELNRQITVVLDLLEKTPQAISLNTPDFLTADLKMIDLFHQVKDAGIRLSFVFFLIPEFILCHTSQNLERESAISALVERHSWAYNPNVLIVLRDIGQKKGILPRSNTSPNIPIHHYESLQNYVDQFLSIVGDPALTSNSQTLAQAITRFFRFGDETVRLSYHSLAPNPQKSTECVDSILFSTITTYLDTTDPDEKSRLEDRLQKQTIYSRRFLKIVANHGERTGIGLSDFLSSEYFSIRAKVTQAILASSNESALPVILNAPRLSMDFNDDKNLRKIALSKLASSQNAATLLHKIDIHSSTETRSTIIQRWGISDDILQRAVQQFANNDIPIIDIVSQHLSMDDAYPTPIRWMVVLNNLTRLSKSRDIDPSMARFKELVNTSAHQVIKETRDVIEMFRFYGGLPFIIQQAIVHPNHHKAISTKTLRITAELLNLIGINDHYIEVQRLDFSRSYHLPNTEQQREFGVNVFSDHYRNAERMCIYRAAWRQQIFCDGFDAFIKRPNAEKVLALLTDIENAPYWDTKFHTTNWIKFRNPSETVELLFQKIHQAFGNEDLEGDDVPSPWKIVPRRPEYDHFELYTVLDQLWMTNLSIADILSLKREWSRWAI